MFHRMQHYRLIDAAGVRYQPRAYGDPQPNGTWEGWLVFFPLRPGTAVAPPVPETTQSTLAALTMWAAGLTPVYLEDALARALARIEQPALIGQLTAAEHAALGDAERLERTAAVERTAADFDEAAAEAARANSERMRRERLVAESALAATEAAAATLEAERHEEAARDARAVAADAARRPRSAQAQAKPQKPISKRQRRGKNRET